jgi:hypothetical protein
MHFEGEVTLRRLKEWVIQHGAIPGQTLPFSIEMSPDQIAEYMEIIKPAVGTLGSKPLYWGTEITTL